MHVLWYHQQNLTILLIKTLLVYFLASSFALLILALYHNHLQYDCFPFQYLENYFLYFFMGLAYIFKKIEVAYLHLFHLLSFMSYHAVRFYINQTTIFCQLLYQISNQMKNLFQLMFFFHCFSLFFIINLQINLNFHLLLNLVYLN